VVLAGPPNAGKSTLLNAMAGRDAAIVSPIAGTTRDRIEAPVVRGGIAYLLIDTAGLADETADPIEAIGIDRARAALDEADISCGSATPPPAASRDLVDARARRSAGSRAGMERDVSQCPPRWGSGLDRALG
jgi:tRNA modification GTPase